MARDALAEITELHNQTHGGCLIHGILSRIDKDLHTGLLSALDPASGLSSRAIVSWLSKEGFKVSERTVQRHRGGACACS